MKLLPKFLFSLFLSLFFVAVTANPTFAQTGPDNGPWYNQGATQFATKVFGGSQDEIFGERYTYAQVNWIINSIAAIFAPPSQTPDEFINNLRNIVDQLAQGEQPSYSTMAQLGAPGILISGMGDVYANPPASGVKYLSESLDSISGVSVVHAQGYGFRSFSVIQGVWSATRNMAYLIMVILLIASGFLIMFRVKINPQTVVSLQTMIPKLIITMLLVTFSYAIAGLVIDLVYVLIAAFIGILNVTSGVIHPSSLSNAISWFTAPSFAGPVIYYFVPWVLVAVVGGIATILTAPLASTGIGAVIPGLTLIITIVAIVVAILLLILLFKIWWMLVKAYVTLMLLIIIGPLQIMLGLIPGQSGFGTWFRNVIANASVFVSVPLMFALNMIIWRPSSLVATIPFLNPLGVDPSASPTFFGGDYPNLPLLGGHGTIFQLAVGFALLALTPKVADMIRDALKIPPFKYGVSMGEVGSGIITASKIISLGRTAGQEGGKVLTTMNKARTAPRNPTDGWDGG